MTLRRFALRLALAVTECVARESIAASVRMSRALQTLRREGRPVRVPGAVPRIVVRGGETYVEHADGRVVEVRGVGAAALSVQRGGRA